MESTSAPARFDHWTVDGEVLMPTLMDRATCRAHALNPVKPGIELYAVLFQEGLVDERWRIVAFDQDDNAWVIARGELISMGALFPIWDDDTADLADGPGYNNGRWIDEMVDESCA